MLTKDEILNMPAGREMDALIALLLGWQVDELTAFSPTGSRNSRHKGDDNWLEYYSTDMTAAWQVVAKMREKGYGFYAEWRQDNASEPLPWALFSNDAHELEFCAAAETMPLAICRAAYLTVMGGDK